MSKEENNVVLDEIGVYHAAQAARARYAAELLRGAVRRLRNWFVANIVAPLRQRNAQRRQLRELMAMDDHMLHDLGLSRSGVYYAFKYGRDLPSKYRADVPLPANTNIPVDTTPKAA